MKYKIVSIQNRPILTRLFFPNIWKTSYNPPESDMTVMPKAGIKGSICGQYLWDAITVYPKKYAHGFCFAVLCCGYTLTDFPISIRLTSLALWQSNDCPNASKATLMNMDKYFMWIHYELFHNHNKAKHNKTVCIFLGIYCTCPSPAPGSTHMLLHCVEYHVEIDWAITSSNCISDFRCHSVRWTFKSWTLIIKMAFCKHKSKFELRKIVKI